MQEEPKTRDRSTTTVVIMLIALVAVIIFVVTRPEQEPDRTLTPFERGQRIYNTTCIACHHLDPSKEWPGKGQFGPPIAGSSFELIKMRVLTMGYPKGYKPKRDTKLMTPFPSLNDAQLRALHTYVNYKDAGKPDEEEDANGK